MEGAFGNIEIWNNFIQFLYIRIKGKIWKFKVTPKNNVFFEKGLNKHTYIYTYIHIYIFIYLSLVL